jgi:hypothetical protein
LKLLEAVSKKVDHVKGKAADAEGIKPKAIGRQMHF